GRSVTSSRPLGRKAMPQGCTRPLAKVSTLMACLVFCAGALVISAEAGVDKTKRPKTAAGRARVRMGRVSPGFPEVMSMRQGRFKARFHSSFRRRRAFVVL